MTREELINKLLEGGKMLPVMQSFEAVEIVDFVLENYTRPEPQGIDEAAEEYARKSENHGEFFELEYEFGEPYEVCVDDKPFVKKAFKAGAKWMADKGFVNCRTYYNRDYNTVVTR